MTRPRNVHPADRPKSASVAVLLSFVWPGFGQLYLGRRRVALAFAIPALILVALLAWQARDGMDVFFARLLLVPSAAGTLVIGTVVLAIWRLASMTWAFIDARTTPRILSVRRGRAAWYQRPRRTNVVFGALVAIVIGMHSVVAWTGIAFLDGFSRVYVAERPRSTPEPGSTPNELGSLPTPDVTPVPGGRINVLLIGADSGLGYDHSLTDSLILVTVDPVAKTVDMMSLPRDIARFSLYTGGTYAGKINSFASYAAARPAQFPEGGFGTLTREVGYLLGAPVHYYAYVDLAGFQAVVDAVGGVDIVNQKQISDPGYGFPDGAHGFFMTPGAHHVDGRRALAYARSRNGPGDNDFTRSRRQQELLISLKAAFLKPANLTNLPAILDALAHTVQTDYPADRLPDLLLLAKQIPEANVTHLVLGPPYARRPTASTGTYELLIDERKFEAVSIRIFGSDSRFASQSPSPSP